MTQNHHAFLGIDFQELDGIKAAYASHISDDGSSLVGDVSNDDQRVYSSTVEEQKSFLKELGISENIFGELK